MSRVANGRAHLSIGEVLSLLQDEFPDVTISKIRFLESQGLLDPERTPSGYRKFYDNDIERLRWILRQQKDHYLPLKVIKDRLDQGEVPGPTSNGVANGADPAPADGSAEPADAAPTVTAPPLPLEVGDTPSAADGAAASPPPPAATGGPARSTSRAAPTAGPTGPPPTTPAAPTGPTAPRPGSRASRRETRPSGQPVRPDLRPDPRVEPAPRPEPLVGGEVTVSLTVDELAEASGLSVRDVRDLERFGLIEARQVGDGNTYDGDALIVARTAAGFLQHGIEARHMRTYKVAIDREAGLFEQIVSPLLKQRNPEARTRAARTVTELIRLGEVMRGVLLRRELRDHLGGR